ncbi:unnamed protein product, partial [marine sediment metagenome]
MALIEKFAGKAPNKGLISKYVGNKAKKSRRGLNMLRHPEGTRPRTKINKR